jgi:hypothetical protein
MTHLDPLFLIRSATDMPVSVVVPLARTRTLCAIYHDCNNLKRKTEHFGQGGWELLPHYLVCWDLSSAEAQSAESESAPQYVGEFSIVANTSGGTWGPGRIIIIRILE